jgi:hypothetical protein
MYPIIRRQRRPFVVEPLPPAKVLADGQKVEAAKVLPEEHKAEPMDKPKSKRAKNVSQPETE